MITQQELATIFPDGVPIPVMKMIFPEKSESMTAGDIRFILNAMKPTDAEPGTVLKNAIRAVSEAFDPSSMLPITENQAQRRAIRGLNRLSALYAGILSAQVQNVAAEAPRITDELAIDIIFHALVDIRGQPFMDTQIEEAMRECEGVWTRIKSDISASPASKPEEPEKYRNPDIFHDAEGRN